jgi:hypothetical protein
MSNPTENIFEILAEENQRKLNKQNQSRKENVKPTKSTSAATAADKSKPKDKSESAPAPQTQNQSSSPQGKLHSRIFVNLSCLFFFFFNNVGTVC